MLFNSLLNNWCLLSPTKS